MKVQNKKQKAKKYVHLYNKNTHTRTNIEKKNSRKFQDCHASKWKNKLMFYSWQTVTIFFMCYNFRKHFIIVT